jgi:hypothetical protein
LSLLLDVLQLSDVGKQGAEDGKWPFGAHTSVFKTESALGFKGQQHFVGKHIEHSESRAVKTFRLFETLVRVLFRAVDCASDARWGFILASGLRGGLGIVGTMGDLDAHPFYIFLLCVI